MTDNVDPNHVNPPANEVAKPTAPAPAPAAPLPRKAESGVLDTLHNVEHSGVTPSAKELMDQVAKNSKGIAESPIQAPKTALPEVVKEAEKAAETKNWFQKVGGYKGVGGGLLIADALFTRAIPGLFSSNEDDKKKFGFMNGAQIVLGGALMYSAFRTKNPKAAEQFERQIHHTIA